MDHVGLQRGIRRGGETRRPGGTRRVDGESPGPHHARASAAEVKGIAVQAQFLKALKRSAPSSAKSEGLRVATFNRCTRAVAANMAFTSRRCSDPRELSPAHSRKRSEEHTSELQSR